MMKEAASLMRTARGLTQKKLREMMNISPEIAKINYERFKSFELPFDEDNSLVASMTFDGAVYKGLGARSLSREDLEWSQNHLAIISGLFGLLRPLDLIQPYRLEMGPKVQHGRGSDLYSFWGDKVTDQLNRDLAKSPGATALVNLASIEYFGAVQPESSPVR